jgi:GNAT superfamily N-acetyltransferase
VLAGPPGVAIDAIDERNVDAYVDTLARGWDLPDDQREPTRDDVRRALSRSPRSAFFFLARVDGEPAGTTGLIVRERHGYLVGAQILDRFRGRGLYRALIAARLALLRDAGRTLAVTHAREATSAPMLEHLGFETAFRSRCYLLPFAEGRGSSDR